MLPKLVSRHFDNTDICQRRTVLKDFGDGYIESLSGGHASMMLMSLLLVHAISLTLWCPLLLIMSTLNDTLHLFYVQA